MRRLCQWCQKSDAPSRLYLDGETKVRLCRGCVRPYERRMINAWNKAVSGPTAANTNNAKE